MKGLSTEVIIYTIVALAIAIVAYLFLSGRFGPGAAQFTKEECKQKMVTACSSYRISGKNDALKNIPKTCADILGVSSYFNSCTSYDDYNSCNLLCRSIEG